MADNIQRWKKIAKVDAETFEVLTKTFTKLDMLAKTV